MFDFRQLSKNWRASCNRACFMYRLVWFSSASSCWIAAVTIIVVRGVFEFGFTAYAGYIACGGTSVCHCSQEEQRNSECADVEVRSFSVRRAADLPSCRFYSSQAVQWGPASLGYSGYICSFPGGKANGEWRWPPTPFAPRLRMSTAITYFPPCTCVTCYGETFTFVWVKSLKT